VELNLNDFVIALSHALDFMEIDILGVVSNHSKRVAYIAMRIAENAGFSPEELFDLVTLAILHDNGIGASAQGGAPSGLKAGLGSIEKAASHCVSGEENLKGYPFLTVPSDIITYHHENYDGSGFFHLRGDDIPCMARIIRLADRVELDSDLRNIDYEGKRKLDGFLEARSGTMFAPALVASFREAAAGPAFWLDLKDEFVGEAIHRRVPKFDKEMSWSEIRGVTAIFSRVIDSKSRFTRLHSQQLSERAGRMGEYYRMSVEEIDKLHIAADLHDIGKLAVGNAILDKPGKLEPAEVDVIQRHTYYTRVSLRSIVGFEDITEWAANHHEKLDGSGYPYGKSASELDFNSRLMGCLDIYQALTELRPYREALSHARTLEIMRDMVGHGKIDGSIVEDIDRAFAEEHPGGIDSYRAAKTNL
jgi:HD-GYP domain-containing protein (c-di-GMP phosphodiesterase class II)